MPASPPSGDAARRGMLVDAVGPDAEETPGAGAVARLEGVGVRYGERWALRDVDLEFGAGERVALIGSSGAGKSTLLSLLNGTVAPTAGTVEVFGEDLAAIGRRRRRAVQRRVGTVYQQFHLVGQLRVVHNVNAGRLGDWSLARALWSLLAPRDVEGVAAALGRMGIADRIYDRTDQLSGGQQQRVALARVLVQDPALVLADEPVSSLDPARSREILELLRDLAVERGRTLVVSLHAFGYALRYCDRVVGLREGRVQFDLPAADVSASRAEELYRITDRQ